MAAINAENRSRVNAARMAHDLVVKLSHTEPDVGVAIRVLEHTVLDLAGHDDLTLCRYGVDVTFPGTRGRVEFVAITARSVIEARFDISGTNKPYSEDATVRLWKHAVSWGFLNSKGYHEGQNSPQDDHPKSSTLKIHFGIMNGQINLRTGLEPKSRVQFTYAELVSVLRLLEASA